MKQNEVLADMAVLVNKFLKLINCKGKNKEVEEWKMN